MRMFDGDQGDADGRAVTACGFRRRQRGGKPGGTLADDNEVSCRAHRATSAHGGQER
jgi:hypothetical protein